MAATAVGWEDKGLRLSATSAQAYRKEVIYFLCARTFTYSNRFVHQNSHKKRGDLVCDGLAIGCGEFTISKERSSAQYHLSVPNEYT